MLDLVSILAKTNEFEQEGHNSIQLIIINLRERTLNLKI